jgi:hypothetical protein
LAIEVLPEHSRGGMVGRIERPGTPDLAVD